jgi:TatD DNase family protein
MSKNLRYIDIHGHLNFSEYDADRDACLARCNEAGVGMITVGTSVETSRGAVELAEKTPNMWATVGIHPTETDTAKTALDEDEKDFQELRRLALNPKVVAIGECGLDYFHTEPSAIPAQKEMFERHIAIANEVKKPLMLHVRSGKKKGDMAAGNAYADALLILKKSAKVPFNFHFFAGSIDDMNAIFAAGGTISFTGVLTFTHDYDELIKSTPLDLIMTETDCPYVAPVPFRGKRNEPAHVVEVAKAIARIRGEDPEKVAAVLLDNARRFFFMV